MIEAFQKLIFYRRLLNVQLELSGLYAAMEYFLEQGTQQSVADVVEVIDSLEKATDNLREEILDIMRKIAGEEVEVIGEITENGFRLGG